MQRLLIVLGAALLLAGLAWRWLSRLPFGRLPGDFRIGGENWSVTIPLATCIVLSVALTLIVWLLRR